MSREQVWYEDIHGLFTPETIKRFVPVKGMTVEESINAVIRFAAYLMLVTLMLDTSPYKVTRALAPIGFTMIASYLYYESTRAPGGGGARRRVAPKAPFTMLNNQERNTAAQDAGRSVRTEAQRQSRPCVRPPTVDNPFMNVTIADYEGDGYDHVGACDTNKATTRAEVTNAFEDNLFRDTSDIFSKNASDRQYYTTPNTQIPNKQTEFANWLYNSKTE